MINQIIIIRSLFKKGRNNIFKIISLGVGLAMGLVLIAKVYMDQSYDDFFPDGDRIYQIQSTISREDDDKEYPQVSGAIAPGMKEEVPEVEVATRYTWLGVDAVFLTPEKNKYRGNLVLADPFLFDVFPRPILSGDVKDVLARPMYAMVSRKIAEKLGDVSTVVGKTIEMDNFPGKTITIGGVFEDIPENSHLKYNVVVSMISISQFYWDGSMNWVGNDRYMGYVKLLSGVTPEKIAPAIRRMQEKNQPMEELKKAGVDLGYALKPLLVLHKGTPEVKRMFMLLSLLAFALIFTAVMNYILIVISSLVNRAKEMAVNKCYGASDAHIYRKMLMETGIDLILSLLLAVLLIFTFQTLIEDLLSATLGVLFSWNACLLLLGVCVIVFFASGLLPGYLYARVPIASAFRNYNENRRFWKLALLFVQFVATGFLVALLMVIARQYDYMVTDDPGYTYENLAYSHLSGVDEDLRQKVIEEVGRLPEVAAVSYCSQIPFGWPSGNNISLPNDDRELFNIADFYSVGNGYLDLMEIPVIEGNSFMEDVTNSREVMVSRKFVEKIKMFVDWPDGAVGKDIYISEHGGPFTICGVYEDFRVGVIGREDTRASIMFYSNKPSRTLMVKYHQLTAEANQKVSDLLTKLIPNKEILVYAYSTELVDLYTSSRKFRDSVLLGGIVALIIALIGLVGYTNDEINRRRRETAIRKVNGATILDILRLFLLDIFRIALPALIVGCCVAGYVSMKWQEQFSEKATVSLVLYILCVIAVLSVILSVVSLNSYRAAIANPAETVKGE
ncbi:putative ABC transport system permease protein [Parabacteroides sp. PM5-20]|uniref:ABC transporter permease n=1 Tax=Parabacteroides sp. PM5-20 TaxID=2940527 RepID=UPI002476DF76|nr:ABC transporter permease [Parabacteroides sp. PM5-20]MDH6534430.1 putative ABC transport system permease protein [Parabacteroides sp. PM5-20]